MNMIKQIAYAWIFFLISLSGFARTPALLIVPVSKAPSIIYSGQTATAIYQVTNTTPSSIPPLNGLGLINLPLGVIQVTTMPGDCAMPLFNLNPGQSCLLRLQITADLLPSDVRGGPQICYTPSHPVYCYQPSTSDMLFIHVVYVPHATLVPNPSSLNFNNVEQGTTTIQTVRITNLSLNSAQNIAASIIGTNTNPIIIDNSSTCTNVLAANSQCDFKIKVTGQILGQDAAVLNITSSNADPVNVSISLNVIPPATPNLVLSSSAVTLATQGVLTPVHGVNPALVSKSRTLTITNTGTLTAQNVQYTINPALPAGTTITPEPNCSTIATTGVDIPVNGSCVLTITPGLTSSPTTGQEVPTPSEITVQGSNTITPTTANIIVLNYGQNYQGGFVFSIDDTTPSNTSVGGKVAAIQDQGTNIIWSSNGQGGDSSNASFDIILGIDMASTSTVGSPSYSTFASFFSSTYTNPNPFTPTSFQACNGKTDGICNTNNILVFYNQFRTNANIALSPPFTASPGPTPLNFYAAGVCKQTINTYSDWYLPAICEMGYSDLSIADIGCGVSASPLMQNMQSNLVDFGGQAGLLGYYNSSTERDVTPNSSVVEQRFDLAFPFQSFFPKDDEVHVRCVRVFNP